MKKIIGVLYILLFIFFSGTLFPMEAFPELEKGKVFVTDKDGNIYTNFRGHVIQKYSPTGKLILKMGRKGLGPGDIRRLAWFALNPRDNHIYVTELPQGNRWVSIFSTEGKYIGDWKIEFDWLKWDGLSFIKFDRDGNAYIMAMKTHYERYKDFSLVKVDRVIFKFLPDGKKAGIIYRMLSDFSVEKPGKGNLTIPYHNYIYFDVWEDKIAVRESCEDFISLFDTHGRLVKKLKLPFKKEKVNDDSIDLWINWLKSFPDVRQDINRGLLDIAYWKRKLPFPGYKPVSGGKLFFDKQGNILSKKYGGFSTNPISTWVKINIQSGDISYKKLKDKLLYPTECCFYIAEEQDDGPLVLKYNRKELEF